MDELHLSEQIHLSGNRGVWITKDPVVTGGDYMITAMYAMFYVLMTIYIFATNHCCQG